MTFSLRDRNRAAVEDQPSGGKLGVIGISYVREMEGHTNCTYDPVRDAITFSTLNSFPEDSSGLWQGKKVSSFHSLSATRQTNQ